MPKGGKGGGGGKAAKIRLMLIKNGDAHCTHLATFSGKPTSKDVLMEAGKRLKGIAQTGKRRLYATDGYPLGDADLATAVMNDIVVVAMDEAFMPLLRNGEVSTKKMKAGGQVYSADSGYSDRAPLGIKSRPAGWDAPVIVKVSSVAAAFGAKADRVCYQPRLKISGVDPGKKRVLVLEADTMEDIDRWHQCLAGAIRRLSSAAGSVSEARQARVEQLRSSAKEATWAVGDIVDVETEEGMQCGVRIIGPSESGDKEEMRVKFADGDVDDWPIDDFCRPKSLLEPEPEPEPELQPEPQVGWLGKRWDKGGGLADRRWFVMRADALEYFKAPDDVAKGKDARGRYPLKDAQVLPREEVQTFTKPAQVEHPGPRLGAAPEFSTLALKGLKKGQSISLGSDESASGFGTGGAVKEWQRLPKTLLEAHCRQKRRHKPVYNNTKDYFTYLLPLQGKRAEGAEIDAAKDGTATADGPVHRGLYGCKLVLPDKQKSTRDLVFYARPQKTQTLANNDAALVALITLESNIPHEKKLPEPFKTSWVELLKTGPPPPPAPPKEEAVSSGRDRSVTKKSEFQLIVMSNANMLRAETVVREWKAASADNIDSKQIDAKQEKEEQPKMIDGEELIVEDLEGADYDGQGDHSAQGQSQGQGEDGDGCKSDLLQSWMDKLSRPPSYEVASTPQAVDMYSVALSFLWEDQADSSCVAPADASCVAADQDHQSEEDEEDWETELDSSARVDELDALKQHFKDNCTVDGGDSVTIVSVCVNLPTLGATTLQCWYLTASDYPSTPPLCLLVGGSMQAPMRLHAMRALRGLASKLSGSPVMRPLLDALVKDDSVIVMPSSAGLQEKAPAVEAPANHQLNSATEHMQMQQEHAAVDVDTAFGIPSNDALVNISDPFLDSESDKTADDITTLSEPQQTRRGKLCPMFTPHQLAGFAPANSQRIEARQRLPAAKKRSALLEILRSDQCVVVTGETGCGKTTQVPQFVLEETKGECFIVCTQPRRLSAIAVASRVADERHENIDGRHSTVGYAVRGESRRTPECRLLFCTTGVLLRRMQQEDLLLEGVRNGTRVTHVIVDEVHERSVDGDHLVCLLRDVMKRRKDLKVILMSATINAELFATYFESCPTLHIPGFTHPVENYYLEDALEATGYNAKGKHENKEDEASLTVQDYAFLQENGCSDGTIRGLKAMDGREKIETGLVAELVIELAKRLLLEGEADGSLTGAILVFLPGMPGIMEVHDSLVFGRRLEEEMAMLASDILWVLPLHSTLSPNDQAKVFQRPAPGRVKVVLSTNICETSITIDDVVCVIDTARVNQTGYDPTTGTSSLQEVWCSKAARRQRAGRAGRVRPGQCWSLVTRKRSEHLLPFPAPEIERVSIEQLLLRIESALANASGRLEVTTSKAMLHRFLDPPSETAIDSAVQMLIEVGALTKDEVLTPLGRHLANIPVELRLAKVLLYGVIFGCIDPILTIVASLGAGRSPMTTPADKHEAADEAHKRFATKGSDHCQLLNIYNAWASISSFQARRDFCRLHFLSDSALLQVATLRQQLIPCLCEIGFLGGGGRDKFGSTASSNDRAANEHSHSLLMVKAVVCAGLYPSLVHLKLPKMRYHETAAGVVETVHRDKGKVQYLLAKGEKVRIHPSSSVGKEVPGEQRNFHFVYYEKVETSQVYLRSISECTPLALAFFGGNLRMVPAADSPSGSAQVLIDGWITFDAGARLANLLVGLRDALDHVVAQKFNFPSTPLASHPVMQAVCHALANN